MTKIDSMTNLLCLLRFFLVLLMLLGGRELRAQKEQLIQPQIPINNEFFDVSLAVEDNYVVQAHKFVLAAASPLFRSLLHNQCLTSNSPLIYLRGIKACDLNNVLDFVYHGSIDVPSNELNSFLAVAEDLQIKGLSKDEEIDKELEPVVHAPPPKRKRRAATKRPVKESEDDDSDLENALKDIDDFNYDNEVEKKDDIKLEAFSEPWETPTNPEEGKEELENLGEDENHDEGMVDFMDNLDDNSLDQADPLETEDYCNLIETRGKGRPKRPPAKKVKPVRKLRGKGKVWNILKTFKTDDELSQYLSEESFWKVNCNKRTNEGKKDYYYCNQSKKCPAKLVAFRRKMFGDIQILRDEADHEFHDETENIWYGIPPSQKKFIEELFATGYTKPRQIHQQLEKANITGIGIIQLRNFLVKIREKYSNQNILNPSSGEVIQVPAKSTANWRPIPSEMKKKIDHLYLSGVITPNKIISALSLQGVSNIPDRIQIKRYLERFRKKLPEEFLSPVSGQIMHGKKKQPALE